MGGPDWAMRTGAGVAPAEATIGASPPIPANHFDPRVPSPYAQALHVVVSAASSVLLPGFLSMLAHAPAPSTLIGLFTMWKATDVIADGAASASQAVKGAIDAGAQAAEETIE